LDVAVAASSFCCLVRIQRWDIWRRQYAGSATTYDRYERCDSEVLCTAESHEGCERDSGWVRILRMGHSLGTNHNERKIVKATRQTVFTQAHHTSVYHNPPIPPAQSSFVRPLELFIMASQEMRLSLQFLDLRLEIRFHGVIGPCNLPVRYLSGEVLGVG
jgi:hypothetical protein